MKRFALLCLVAPLYLSSPAVAQNLCDDIDTVANGWNELANFMAENGADGFSAEEADSLDALMDMVDEPSRVLAMALIEVGNPQEQELGERLRNFLDELGVRERGDRVDYLVALIDDIVDTIDAIVDYCDEVNSTLPTRR